MLPSVTESVPGNQCCGLTAALRDVVPRSPLASEEAMSQLSYTKFMSRSAGVCRASPWPL